MVRQDIIDLKKTIDTWCNCIRSATELWDAMVCRSCALQAVDDAVSLRVKWLCISMPVRLGYQFMN